MNKQIEIPKELKRWNWGAFLLAPLWCMRHGIWQGLLLLVPFFGFLIPFFLGAKGNQKAWAKNSHEPVEVFLKRQKRWSFAGAAIWTVFLVTIAGSLSYSLNYSEGMKMGLEVANSNKRLMEYFGKPIQKSSFLNGTYIAKPSLLTVAFDAIGTQHRGTIHLQWEKRDAQWVATEMSFEDSEGNRHHLVETPMIKSSFFDPISYEKTHLENALTQMIEEKKGFVILSRSKKNNDFIQSAIQTSKDGSVAFDVVFSDGFNRKNKKIYQSRDPVPTKEEVLKLFTLYATGSDAHINAIKWNKLTAIEEGEGKAAHFFFDEPL